MIKIFNSYQTTCGRNASRYNNNGRNNHILSSRKAFESIRQRWETKTYSKFYHLKFVQKPEKIPDLLELIYNQMFSASIIQ